MKSARKIVAAGIATDRVQAEVRKALEALSGFSSHMNAFGVFTDALHQRSALAVAREAIERAEKIMQQTAWPVPEDYE
jgi:hypothetical protein